MTFDVQEHMGDLPMDRLHLGREIETRNYELTKLSYLSDILSLAKKPSLSKSDEMKLQTKIRIIAQDINHLNTSRFGNISSGGNGEVLARLVGADILTDFPEVKDGDYDKPDVVYSYDFIGDKKNKDVEIKLHTEFTREREDFEGDGGPVATVADFRYSKPKLDERTKKLNEEVKALYEQRNKVIHKS